MYGRHIKAIGYPAWPILARSTTVRRGSDGTELEDHAYDRADFQKATRRKTTDYRQAGVRLTSDRAAGALADFEAALSRGQHLARIQTPHGVEQLLEAADVVERIGGE